MKNKNLSLKLFSIFYIFVIVSYLQKYFTNFSNIFFDICFYILEIPMLLYAIKNYKGYFSENKKKIKKIKFFNFYLMLVFISLINFFLLILIDFNINLNFIKNTNQKISMINLIFSFIFTVILDPILEEIVFRGMIKKDLKMYGYKIQMLVSTLLFTFFHLDITSIFPIFFYGIIFFLISSYSLKYSIFLHILHNFTVFIFKKNKLYFSKINDILIIIYLLMVVLSIVFVIYNITKGKLKMVFSLFILNRREKNSLMILFKNNKISIIIIFALFIFNFINRIMEILKF